MYAGANKKIALLEKLIGTEITYITWYDSLCTNAVVFVSNRRVGLCLLRNTIDGIVEI